MLPLFKSHFSIGKSILTLDSPKDYKDPNVSSDSVFDLAVSHDLEKVILVEDSFMGFLQALKVSEEINRELIFGIRFDICSDVNKIDLKSKSNCTHKIIIFPKNKNGCGLINALYTQSRIHHNSWLDLNIIKKIWKDKDLMLCIPFYDSFIFSNLMKFQSCIVDFSFTTPTFFLESNGLPFDSIIKDGVLNYCNAYDFPIEKSQSIYYKDKSDFDSFLTYKLICSRSSFSGKEVSIEKPNIDHFGSDEFCFQSYLEKCET